MRVIRRSGQRVHLASYKMNIFWGYNSAWLLQLIILHYMLKVAKKVNFKCSYTQNYNYVR